MSLAFYTRHPEKERFALPNTIWSWQLRPREFVLLACLYYQSGQQVTADAIAESVHMSEITVRKYLASLMERGLITTKLSPTYPLNGGSLRNCFTLPNEIFFLRLPPSAFMVYAYLLCCEDRRTYQCHPSYNTIASATHLAVNTVMKSVSELAERQLIMVEQTRYLDHRGMKWIGNNCYTILPIASAVEQFYQRQFRQLEVNTAKYNTAKERTA